MNYLNYLWLFKYEASKYIVEYLLYLISKKINKYKNIIAKNEIFSLQYWHFRVIIKNVSTKFMTKRNCKTWKESKK